MAVTNTAAFGQAPRMGYAVLTSAKTGALSGSFPSTGIYSLFTAGSNGSIVNGIAAIPRDTLSSAAHIAIYYSDDSGATVNLCAIGLLAAWTLSATTAPTPLNLTNLNGSIISVANPLYVPAGQVLYASSSQALANGISVVANGIDL